MRTTTRPPSPVDTSVGLTRRRLLTAAPLVLGGVTVAALMVVVPWGERNEIGYQAVAPLRDAAWAGILADVLAVVAVSIGLALVVCQLTTRTGALEAEVGAVLTVVGGVLFALGSFSFVSLAWYATDTRSLTPAQGEVFLDHVLAHPQHGVLLQVVGFLTFTLGTVLLCVALLRAGTVSRWLPVAVLVTTALLFVVPSARGKDLVQMTQMLALAAIGLAYLRARPHGLRAASAPGRQGS